MQSHAMAKAISVRRHVKQRDTPSLAHAAHHNINYTWNHPPPHVHVHAQQPALDGCARGTGGQQREGGRGRDRSWAVEHRWLRRCSGARPGSPPPPAPPRVLPGHPSGHRPSTSSSCLPARPPLHRKRIHPRPMYRLPTHVPPAYRLQVLDALLLRALPALLYTCVLYPLVGLQGGPASAAAFGLVLFTFAACVGALALCVAALAPTTGG